ncbi:hypothetical protein [Shewanella gaetbuli]
MSQNEHQLSLAKHLFAQRTATTPASEYQAYNVSNIDEAFEVQQAMVSLFAEPVDGWKCLTPQANEQLIFAPILSKVVDNQPSCPIVPATKDGQTFARIEPEIAIVLSEDFLPHTQYSNEQIEQGIGATHLALELIQSRFSADYKASYLEMLADGLSNQGLYLGPKIDKALAYQASKLTIKVTSDDKVQEFAGAHPCTLPQNPVFWLIQYLTDKGVHLKKGQAIITGSYCGVVNVPMNTPVTLLYQGLGEMTVSFTAK